MRHKYGEFNQHQVSEIKNKLRKKIFYLLIIAENEFNEREEARQVNLYEAFDDVLTEINGFNDLLGYPPEIVECLSLLNAARMEYASENYNFSTYRKLILDAGAVIPHMKEV